MLLGASLLLLPLIGSEFLPPSDEGEVRVTGRMENGTRLDLIDRQTRKMEAIIAPAVPEAVASVVNIGGAGWRPDAGSEGEISLSLLPVAQRGRSNVAIAEDLRKRLAGRVPGMEIRVRAPQGQFVLERILGSDEGLTVDIRGHDLSHPHGPDRPYRRGDRDGSRHNGCGGQPYGRQSPTGNPHQS